MVVTKEDVFGFIDKMTILELSDFIKEFEERYGVTASTPATVALAGVSQVGTSLAAEEKSSFDVILISAGDKKIQVIKVVRELTGLGLKEAKDLVDGVPKPVKTGVSKEDANVIVSKLETEGAKVEIK